MECQASEFGTICEFLDLHPICDGIGMKIEDFEVLELSKTLERS